MSRARADASVCGPQRALAPTRTTPSLPRSGPTPAADHASAQALPDGMRDDAIEAGEVVEPRLDLRQQVLACVQMQCTWLTHEDAPAHARARSILRCARSEAKHWASATSKLRKRRLASCRACAAVCPGARSGQMLMRSTAQPMRRKVKTCAARMIMSRGARERSERGRSTEHRCCCVSAPGPGACADPRRRGVTSMQHQSREG